MSASKSLHPGRPLRARSPPPSQVPWPPPARPRPQATIIINNINAPGRRFQRHRRRPPRWAATRAPPVGEQRLIAFTYAANLWGATLTSTQPIIINAQFTALTCTATGGVLGSAGATSDLPRLRQRAQDWPTRGIQLRAGQPHLRHLSGHRERCRRSTRTSTSNLGSPGCLEASGWYYGLDSNQGTLIDFVAVLQHEMASRPGLPDLYQRPAPARRTAASRRSGTTSCSASRPTSCGRT